MLAEETWTEVVILAVAIVGLVFLIASIIGRSEERDVEEGYQSEYPDTEEERNERRSGGEYGD